MRRLTSLALALATLAACSDDGGNPIDDAGSTSDAATTTDSPSGGPDAKPPADAGLDAVTTPDATGPEPPGIFVVVGYGGRTARSVDDGLTWTDDKALVPNGGDDNYLLRTVVWAKDHFLALGWRSMTSPDGKTWTDHGVLKGTNWFGSVVWDGTQLVAVGGYGMKVTSADGATWQDHSIDTGAAHAWDGLARSGTAFATTNDDGVRAHSNDGKTWTASTGSATKTKDIAFGNGVFVAIGGTAVLRSTDGGATFQSAATLGAPADGLIFAQGHFTTWANGHAYTSQDGTTWTDHAVAGDQRATVAYGHGTYVRIAGDVRMRSTDGITWTHATPNGQNGNWFSMVTFGAQ